MNISKKLISKIIIVLVLTATIISLTGCNNSEDDKGTIIGPDVRAPLPHLAVKGNNKFSVDDVTLTFYCGSENAGKDDSFETDAPAVTYIYFADSSTHNQLRIDDLGLTSTYVEGFAPQDMYSTIETKDEISVCKKILSTDPDSFYKNNTVELLYKDVAEKKGIEAAEAAWGKGSPFYKTSEAFLPGVCISDISYVFTIPKKFFTKEKGYVFYCMASYLTEDFDDSTPTHIRIGKEGALLESQELVIYYLRQGDTVTLSRKYMY